MVCEPKAKAFDITIRVPYRYSDSEIYINGKPMLSWKGPIKFPQFSSR